MDAGPGDLADKLAVHNEQLLQVDILLSSDPSNETLLNIKRYLLKLIGLAEDLVWRRNNKCASNIRLSVIMYCTAWWFELIQKSSTHDAQRDVDPGEFGDAHEQYIGETRPFIVGDHCEVQGNGGGCPVFGVGVCIPPSPFEY